jgi:hypothetical protein
MNNMSLLVICLLKKGRGRVNNLEKGSSFHKSQFVIVPVAEWKPLG